MRPAGIKMVVKSDIGRKRYIVFKIEEGTEITKKDLIYTFNRTLPSHPEEFIGENKSDENGGEPIKAAPSIQKILQDDNEKRIIRHNLKYFDGHFGILLCPHWLKVHAIETIGSIERVGIRKKPVKLVSVGTSGSLKKARKKYLQ